MNEKDFRKLKRVELYEIMLAQAEEIDDLRAKLAAARIWMPTTWIKRQSSAMFT